MSGPGFQQHLSQRQTQQMVLAPQLRQSLKILQVAALDLRSVIQEELQNNPTIEELPMDGMSLEQNDSEAADGASPAADSTAPDAEGAEPREELDFSKSFEILSKIDDDWRDDLAQGGGGPRRSSVGTAGRQERRRRFRRQASTSRSCGCSERATSVRRSSNPAGPPGWAGWRP